MKYKVGDKVKVRKDLKLGGTYGEYYVTNNMHKLAGDTVTISSVHDYGYKIFEDNGICHWADKMFDPVAKKLIEPGSIVECRNGYKYIYLNGIFMDASGDTLMSFGGLDSFTDDLISEQKSFDIMRIFKSNAKTLNEIFDTYSLSVIWKRKETKEMTLEEIEKALGYPVKIVEGE